MDFRRDSNYSGGGRYPGLKIREQIQAIEAKLAHCFAHGPPQSSKAIRLYKHLRMRQDQLLRFLYNPNVPFDNNASERALRHWALLRKVFGGFRTLTGISRYDILLSVIESAKRQRLNVLDVLSGQAQLAFG